MLKLRSVLSNAPSCGSSAYTVPASFRVARRSTGYSIAAMKPAGLWEATGNAAHAAGTPAVSPEGDGEPLA